jgi:CelD/BcsL family acetyltransferase involved in cellulose biosynthesis
VNVTVVSAGELGPADLARWSALQQARAVYRSPFYAPAFALAVARVREVRVAIIQDGGAVTGFFPFELGRGRAGRPAGAGFSDYQGVVHGERAELEPLALIRACGVAGWSFDHVPAELSAFAPYVHGCGASPCVDLRAGFDAYLAARNSRSSFRDRGRRARRLEREAGPLRFVAATDAPEVLDLLVAWKREQYAKTGVRDVLADARARALLREVHASQGVLSVLYAGDEIAAVHLGLRCGSVLHSWFPAYNAELHRHSPGLLLMLELAQAAPGLGITEIDLGKGDARYKQALATGSVELWEGRVGRHALAGRVRSSARRMVRSAGVHRAVRRALRR